MAYITPDDLAAFATIDAAKAEAMIADAEAMAALVAPCLTNAAALSEPQAAAVKGILRQAILRRDAAGNAGEVTSQTRQAGQFSLTETIQAHGSRGLFWPSEINDLQAICKQLDQSSGAKAFAVDTVGGRGPVHSPYCDLMLGGTTCSCGSILNGGAGPLWELP